MVGKNSSSKSKFRCTKNDCNHEWCTTLNNVFNKNSGCKKCANKLPLTEVDRELRLVKENIPAKVIKHGKTTQTSDTLFKCLNKGCNHEWVTKYTHVLNGGRRCPDCAVSGFKSNKPGHVYTILIQKGVDFYYGFGITNSIKDRIPTHRRNLTVMGYTVVKEYEPIYFELGLEATLLEAKWKKSRHIVDIGVEGFKTECVSVNEETTKMIFS